MQQALLIILTYDSVGLPASDALQSFQAIEEAVITAIEDAGVGEWDGHASGEGAFTIFLYGDDANALWAAAEGALAKFSLRPGTYAIKRYGEIGSEKVRVDIGGQDGAPILETADRGEAGRTKKHAAAMRSSTPKLRVGDVLEFETKRGFAYAQVSHFHRSNGELTHIMVGDFDRRPMEICTVVREPVRFSCWLPAKLLVARNTLSVVARCDVPDSRKALPIFRSGVPDPRTGKVDVWWLWDGETEWRVGTLTPEQRKYPMTEVIGIPTVIHRIESGWNPESDPR